MSETKRKRSAISLLISHLPKSMQDFLNKPPQQGLRERREFLKIINLLFTTGLSAIIFPRATEAMTPFAFWKKRSSGTNVGVYPTNTGADPYWDYVVLCMNMDLPTPSTGFTTVFADESHVGKNPTLTGSPFINTGADSSPYAGKTGSAKLSGLTEYISFSSTTDLDFGTGDFTAEFWLNIPSQGGNTTILSKRSPGNGNWLLLYIPSGTTIALLIGNGTSWPIDIRFSITAGQWTHIALARKSGSVYAYANGVQKGSTGNYSGAVGFSSSDTLMIGADGGGGNGYMTGSLTDLRIYKGIAKYTTAFTPPSSPIGLGTASDPYWGYCVLACPFESSLKDMSGTRSGANGAATLTASTKKFGTASASFNGSNSCIFLGNGLSKLVFNGPYTIEGWVYLNDTTQSSTIFSIAVANSFQARIDFRINSGKLSYFGRDASFNVNGTPPADIALTAGAWNHVALVYKGGTSGNNLLLFANGVMSTPGTLAGPCDTSGTDVWIGRVAWTDGGYFNGYIDSLRITKGFARYTANFTPPTASFAVGKDETVDPFWSSTSLLIQPKNTDTSITDTTGRHTVTSTGSPAVSSTSLFPGYGSIAFNGSNYLNVASSSDFLMSTGDYTVEFWVKQTAGGGHGYYAIANASASSSAMRFYGSNSSMYAEHYSGGSGTNLVGFSYSGFNNQVNHYAIVCQSGKLIVYANGVYLQSITTPGTMNNSALALTIGYEAANGFYTTGNLYSFRITKGIARYVNNFTLPTVAFSKTPIGG